MLLLGKVRMQGSNLIIGDKFDTTFYFYRRKNGCIDHIIEHMLSVSVGNNIER